MIHSVHSFAAAASVDRARRRLDCAEGRRGTGSGHRGCFGQALLPRNSSQSSQNLQPLQDYRNEERSARVRFYSQLMKQPIHRIYILIRYSSIVYIT